MSSQRQQNRQQMAQQRQDFAQDMRNQNWDNYNDHYDDWGHWGAWGSGWWAPMTAVGLGSFFGSMAGSAIAGSFDDDSSYVSYGDGGGGYAGESVTYQSGDTIIVNDEEAGTSQAQTEQAAAIVSNYDDLTATMPPPPMQTEAQPAASAPAADDNWLPLGLYMISPESGVDATQYYQLMVNKKGAIAGMFHDLKADTSTPVEGAIDSNTKTAAWTVSGTKQMTQTGLYNLTQSETQALAHDGLGGSRHILLVRVEQPAATETKQPARALP